jgi:hypothetical protein
MALRREYSAESCAQPWSALSPKRPQIARLTQRPCRTDFISRCRSLAAARTVRARGERRCPRRRCTRRPAPQAHDDGPAQLASARRVLFSLASAARLMPASCARLHHAARRGVTVHRTIVRFWRTTNPQNRSHRLRRLAQRTARNTSIAALLHRSSRDRLAFYTIVRPASFQRIDHHPTQ